MFTLPSDDPSGASILNIETSVLTFDNDIEMSEAASNHIGPEARTSTNILTFRNNIKIPEATSCSHDSEAALPVGADGFDTHMHLTRDDGSID
jgi:hypothetical protein